MALDPDIASADALTLSRITAQEVRDNIASQKAFRASQLQILQDFTTGFRAAYASLPTEAEELDLKYRRDMLVVLASKYMTTSTSTAPATVLADAVNDTARMKAAYEEVLKIVP